ncbi:MAG: polyprenyl synthetase family protein [Tissierellales bacterium]|nr:polyprenyl synthetase family protein [Tissierellales bacterium]
MSKFWASIPEVNDELEAINNIILETNTLGHKYLNDSLNYMFSSGGKMLRPAFVLIGSQFGDQATKSRLHNLAAAVEILHSATLIHDDIIDEAYLRRKQPTIQAKYSKEYAVYMGDFLFSQCFLMLAEYEVSTDVLKYMAKGINIVCRGEMLQNALRYDQDISTRNYLKIITGKTAALFAASLSVGAKEAGADEALVKSLAKIGGHVGMAFQLIDDLLDYESTAAEMGKDVQGDIVKGYYSLPMIKALKTVYGDDMKAILNKKSITSSEVTTLIDWSRQSGGVESTRRLAEKYTAKAMKGVHDLPEGRGKDLLLQIVPMLLERKY